MLDQEQTTKHKKDGWVKKISDALYDVTEIQKLTVLLLFTI